MASSDLPTLVVMASGRGSNFQALLDAAKSGRLSARIAGLVVDQKNAPVIERAEGIPIRSVIRSEFPNRKSFEGALADAVSEFAPSWVVLAGFMRVLSPHFLKRFWDPVHEIYRVVNIHPSILPAFPGLKAYDQAWKYGVKISGCTVHLVDEKVDHGPIVMQKAFNISPEDSLELVEKRGLALEHATLVQAMGELCQENFRVVTHPSSSRRSVVLK